MARTRRPSFFPVAQHQLPRIHVTPEQHDELRAYMLPMAHEVVRDGPTWGRTNVQAAQRAGWKLVASTPESCFLTKSSSGTAATASTRSTQYSKGRGKHTHTTTAAATSASASMQAPQTPGQCFMGTSLVPYSLEDVMSSAYCETTEELRAHFTGMYGAACLDSCVLATLEGATLADPFWYVGIKWLALKSPVRTLVSSREFVYLEHSGSHVARDGRRVLFRIFQSVNISAYGGQDSYFGLTRGHVEAAFVYWLEDPSDGVRSKPMLRVGIKGRAHLRGSLPLWLVQRYLTRFWHTKRALRAAEMEAAMTVPDDDHDEQEPEAEPEPMAPALTITRAASLPIRSSAHSHSHSSQSSSSRTDARRKRSDATSTTSSSSALLDMATTWVPDDARSTCYVCQRKFQRVRRPKHHCRSCGEVICSDCTSYSKLNVEPLLARSRKREGARHIDAASRAAVAAGVGKPARAPAEHPDNALVTIGKVCYRCMELKTIMHNNSAYLELEHERPRPNRANTRSSSARYDRHTDVDAVTDARASLQEEKAAAVASLSTSDPGAHRETLYRPGRQSSLSSSEVRAMIEENGLETQSNSTRAASGRAMDSVADDDDDARAMNTSERQANGDDDDDDDGASEDLEFQPVLVAAVSAHELLADADSEYASSFASFDPDRLFDLDDVAMEQRITEYFDTSSSDDDDYDDESIVLLERASSILGLQEQQQEQQEQIEADAMHQRELLRSSLSLSTASALSRVTSPTASNSGPSSRRVSITDVKLAIADQTKLLEEIKREHDDDNNNAP